MKTGQVVILLLVGRVWVLLVSFSTVDQKPMFLPSRNETATNGKCVFISVWMALISLHIAYWLPPTAYGLLPIVYCLLPVAYCLLPIVYCLSPSIYCFLLQPKAGKHESGLFGVSKGRSMVVQSWCNGHVVVTRSARAVVMSWSCSGHAVVV